MKLDEALAGSLMEESEEVRQKHLRPTLPLNIHELNDKWENGCKKFDIPTLNRTLTIGLYKFIAFL